MGARILQLFNGRPRAGAHAAEKSKVYRTLAYWIVTVLYFEIVFKAVVYRTVFSSALFYTVLFSLALAALLFFLTTLFSRRVNFVITLVVTAVLFAYFCVQLIYCKVFDNPLIMNFVQLADQGFQWREIVYKKLAENWGALLLLALPLVFVCVFGRRVVGFDRSDKRLRVISGASAAGMYCLSLLALFLSGHAMDSAYSLYYEVDSPKAMQRELGVITSTRLDLKRLIFGFEESYNAGKDPSLLDPDSPDPQPAGPAGTETAPPATTDPTAPETTRPPEDYGYNVMEIDFDALIAKAPNKTIQEMHEYFKKVKPTSKNQYTGKFKGDNLVMITAEAFSPYAIHKELTPTLYKLAQESIQFENFYNVSWGNSTTDGEYAACFGQIPSNQGRSPEIAGKQGNYLPFLMGHQLSPALGYGTNYAYHNYKYEFYGRHISHAAMGYKFRGNDNGFDGKGLGIPATWPASDHEMMKAALPDFINQDKFHAYFMTFSGHMGYAKGSNSMASRHWDKTAILEGKLPEAARGYIACHIELDLMLEELLRALEQAGKLDDTVIVLSPDHYPYGLKEEELNALAGHAVDRTFGINKSQLIVWKNNLEKITVKKPVASIDILPTISNLFGVEYDSRLLAGRDALSNDEEGLVTFAYWEWITDTCFYAPKQGVVSFSGDEAPSSEYVQGVRAKAYNRAKYSQLALDQDYFAYVFGKK